MSKTSREDEIPSVFYRACRSRVDIASRQTIVATTSRVHWNVLVHRGKIRSLLTFVCSCFILSFLHDCGPERARNPNLDSDQRIASYACAHVYNRDAETGNWNFVLQLRTIRMQKMCQSQQFVTWGPSFCQPAVTPAQTFAGRKLKTRRSSMMFSFFL